MDGLLEILLAFMDKGGNVGEPVAVQFPDSELA